MRIRCSELGAFMGNGRTKGSIGQSCYTLLDEMMIQSQYNRRKLIHSKYMTKGIESEEDSITLYSQTSQNMYFKNAKKFVNDWIVGTPDIIQGGLVIDIKTSWDIFTFHNAELNKDYEWQLRGYMWLTGCERAELVYCLVDCPPMLLADELYRLNFKFEGGDSNPEYEKAAEQLRLNLSTENIPAHDRIKVYTIERDREAENAIIERTEAIQEYVKNWKL